MSVCVCLLEGVGELGEQKLVRLDQVKVSCFHDRNSQASFELPKVHIFWFWRDNGTTAAIISI